VVVVEEEGQGGQCVAQWDTLLVEDSIHLLGALWVLAVVIISLHDIDIEIAARTDAAEKNASKIGKR
jgi:hypothetical protein